MGVEQRVIYEGLFHQYMCEKRRTVECHLRVLNVKFDLPIGIENLFELNFEEIYGNLLSWLDLVIILT